MPDPPSSRTPPTFWHLLTTPTRTISRRRDLAAAQGAGLCTPFAPRAAPQLTEAVCWTRAITEIRSAAVQLGAFELELITMTIRSSNPMRWRSAPSSTVFHTGD